MSGSLFLKSVVARVKGGFPGEILPELAFAIGGGGWHLDANIQDQITHGGFGGWKAASFDAELSATLRAGGNFDRGWFS